MELQNGRYPARAKSWALAEAGTGTPEVAIEFQFQGENAPTETITWHGYLTEGALPVTVKALRTCGWQGDDLSDLTGLDANEVSLAIENEEYEGKTYPKVKWVNAPGGLAVKAQMSPEKAKSFADQMRARIRAIDAQQGKRAPANGAPKQAAQPRPPSGPPEPPPLTDADIPF